MRYLIALLLPWLAFFTLGMPISGVICLILQLTLIGWLPAAIWAFFAVNNYYAEQREIAFRRGLGGRIASTQPLLEPALLLAVRLGLLALGRGLRLGGGRFGFRRQFRDEFV